MANNQDVTHTPRFNVLTRENYDTWRIQAKALFVKNDVWDYISGETPTPALAANNATAAEKTVAENAHKAWLKADRKARSDLILSISPSELKDISGCATSHEIWMKLESIHASKTPARKAALYKRLTQHKMAEGGDVCANIKEFFEAADKLKATDATLDNDLLCMILLLDK